MLTQTGMLGLRSRLLVVVAAVFVAVPALVTANVSYLCRMTGQVSSDCCCAGDQHAAPPSGAQVEREECCQLLKSPAHAASSMPREVAQNVPPAAPLALVWLKPRSVASRVAHVTREDRPPPALGPPRFLRHCAFLI